MFDAGKVRQGRAGQGRAGQGRAGQGRAGQGGATEGESYCTLMLRQHGNIYISHQSQCKHKCVRDDAAHVMHTSALAQSAEASSGRVLLNSCIQDGEYVCSTRPLVCQLVHASIHQIPHRC